MHRRALIALVLLAVACAKKDAAPAAPAPASASAAAAVASASPPASAAASASASPTASAVASASASASPPPSFATFPGTPAGAKALATELLKPGADPVALTKQLRPTSADYRAIFDAPTAAKLDSVYAKEWDKGTFVVTARPGQTEVTVVFASVADLKASNDRAKALPSAYARIAPHLVGSATLYRFQFVEPGKPDGSAYDGLAHVNGHWVLIPKPWRGLDDH